MRSVSTSLSSWALDRTSPPPDPSTDLISHIRCVCAKSASFTWACAFRHYRCHIFLRQIDPFIKTFVGAHAESSGLAQPALAKHSQVIRMILFSIPSFIKQFLIPLPFGDMFQHHKFPQWTANQQIFVLYQLLQLLHMADPQIQARKKVYHNPGRKPTLDAISTQSVRLFHSATTTA